ncbi:BTAD domain-containing putative transcriptional regulator [Amycolatopsis sp. A133]|uniref:BTAD domain-containing putative transcriptional regulator n=1 Tax=Amycolatopsis sp. A133 TaxID=3064472 RepID=UPI0027F8C6C8|nr:BTAD domain-containing putative transcriptional regulator [Amycolatopsis sp. A133]MDQ7808796.1 BTAD domain-containing putative transcriptional regulator [Amycolatopsis sp. A133]
MDTGRGGHPHTDHAVPAAGSEPFSALLRRRRAELGITQAELARRAGVSVRAVRYLEQGRTRNPRKASLRQLVAALEPGPGEPAEAATRVGVLGPLLVEARGAQQHPGDTRWARLLGLLALQPNRPVAVDDIVDVLWNGRPPRSHLDLIGSSVRRVRALLHPHLRLAATGRGGYRLEGGPDQLDVLRFDARLDEASAAKAAEDREGVFRALGEAMACWRGPVLAGHDVLHHHAAVAALSRRRLSAALAHADAGISLGRHEEVVAQLESMREAEPMHEGLHARLMVALAGSGRQAAALALFDDLHARLTTELGIEPGPEIRAARLHVLRQEVPAAARPFGSSSNFLPRDVEHFVGRVGETVRLIGAAGRAAVYGICGMAGVGKTALAVHLGYRFADRFPDGQLFADLHAHGPDGPLAPEAALDSLLRQLGVDGARIPEQLDQRAALWRSLLVGRNALVVLDDAADAAQVRPLLPGGPGSLVLITSRGRLTSIDAVTTLSLDVLAPAEAAQLLTRVAGAERTGRDPALGELARLCGYLPLALRIAAARLRDRPMWTVKHLAGLLCDEHRRLAELSTGDRSVGAAFTLSYRQLTAPQQRLFRLLGEFPGTDVDAFAAAAIAGRDLRETESLLEELVDVHLLAQPALGRYRFHDLIRDHARATGLAGPAEPREAAANRMFDYYLHVAGRAADVLEPTRKRFPPAGSPPSCGPRFGTEAEALAWLEAERANLAAVAAAAARDRPRHCWQLVQTLWRFYFVRGHVHDWIRTHRLALRVVRTLDEPVAEAELRKNLGLAHWRSGDFAEAVGQHHRALALDLANGDGWGQAKTHNHLGFIHARGGSHGEALAHHRRAVRLYRAAGDRCGEARALVGLGDLHHHAGRRAESAADFRRGLALAREAGDRWGEALAAIGLGFSASPRHARHHLEHGLAYARAAGDRWGESMALTGLGIIRHAHGDLPEATNCLRQAVALAQEAGDRWWERIATTALGRVHTALGHHTEAAAHHERAVELARGLEDEVAEADALAALAETSGARRRVDAQV